MWYRLYKLSRTSIECGIGFIIYLELALSVADRLCKLNRSGTECGISFISYLELALTVVYA